jgi:Putative Flp pilus-assembly TadE/G-like
MERTMSRNRQAGQALYITAASLVVLAGFMGLAIDLGMLRYEKRLQQTAADAGAVAAANNMAFEGASSVVCAGQNASAANGFTDTSGGGSCANGSISSCSDPNASIGTICVQVNNPPSSGPHAGSAYTDKYAEVLVSAVHQTYFMKIFGTTKETVTARAVATSYSGGPNTSNCMYTLGDPAKEIGVDPYGHTTLNATTCGIVDNGNYDPTGNALTVNACSFNVSGSNTGNNSGGNVYCNSQPMTPSYASPTQQDPFANKLSAPSVGTPQSWGGGSTISPGTYNGINIGGGANVTFQPGVYVVTGNDFTWGANATISGTGVMFYFTNGATINAQGGATVNLTAMTDDQASGAGYPADAGILMWEDASDTNTGIPTNGNKAPCPPPGNGPNTGPEIDGNDGSTFNGVLYFPADQLYLTGNTATTAGISIGASITNTVCMGGNSVYNLEGQSGIPAPLPTLSDAVLVE